MRTVRKPKTGRELRKRRHLRVRKKVEGTPERPRLVVFRSLKHIYAHLVDDLAGKVLMGVADSSEGVPKTDGGKIANISDEDDDAPDAAPAAKGAPAKGDTTKRDAAKKP